MNKFDLSEERDYLFGCGYCGQKGENRINFSTSGKRLDMKAVIAELDSYFEREDLLGAREFLESNLAAARELGDKTGELSILSELMGFHRRTADADAALRACREGIALIGELEIGKSISGATVLLNAATTMADYGEVKAALPYFSEVLRVFSDNLDPSDYRMAGLYNNFATACVAAEDFDSAEKYYLLALALVEKNRDLTEIAVTNINLAELYLARADEKSDELIKNHVERALSALEAEQKRDSYYAFTCRKCAPALLRLGFFFDAKKLKERADAIYAGN